MSERDFPPRGRRMDSPGRRSSPQSSVRPRSPPLSCRLFIGNLACERVSKPILRRIFEKYGKVLEISMHTSFGFVQFDSPEAARRAMENETGQVLAGLTLDISLATHRPGGRPQRSRPKGLKGPPPRRRRSPPRGRRRSRSRSPPRRGAPPPRRRNSPPPPRHSHSSVAPPTFSSSRPIALDCLILISGKDPSLKGFADTLGLSLADVGLNVDSMLLSYSQRVENVLQDLQRDRVPFACVLDDPKGLRPTVDIHILQSRRDVFRDVFLSEAVNILQRAFANAQLGPAEPHVGHSGFQSTASTVPQPNVHDPRSYGYVPPPRMPSREQPPVDSYRGLSNRYPHYDAEPGRAYAPAPYLQSSSEHYDSYAAPTNPATSNINLSDPQVQQVLDDLLRNGAGILPQGRS